MADQQPFAGMAQETTLLDAEFLLGVIANALQLLQFDASRRLRVSADVVANISTISAVTTVGSITNVANQTAIGGASTTPYMSAMLLMAEADLIARL